MVAIADIYPSGWGVDSLIQLLVAAFAGTHFPVFIRICGDPRTVMIVAEGGFRFVTAARVVSVVAVSSENSLSQLHFQ